MKIAVSCLIDNSPKFAMQGWNWLTSLHAVGTAMRADIFVCHTPMVAKETLDFFERSGAKLITIQSFGEGPAVYCNKIRQLESGIFHDYDYTILSDADLFFLSCPTRLATGEAVRAKLVDAPNPPERIWRELLERAGLADRINAVPIQLQADSMTFSTCFNGGLYVLPKASIDHITKKWAKWSRYCLDQSSLLGEYVVHSDQLGFGMALLEGIDSSPLPIGENFPSHLSTDHYRCLPETQIHAIHYHSLDSHGCLLPVETEWINNRVITANRILIENRRLSFNNRIFWDFRYFASPQLGSGLGSRGDVLRLKKSLLRPFMKAISEDSVLDVGCGDLEVMRLMPLRSYRGIDISRQAVEIARTKRPDWRFDNIGVEDVDDNAYDYVICLDVLIHQSSAERFEELVADLLRVARKGVIVAGYEQHTSNHGIVFTHLSLLEALQRCRKTREVEEIGSYRDVSLYLALTDQGLPLTAADASLFDLAYGCEETVDWRLLSQLTRISREKLGFFPKTIIRTIEYPWFANRLRADPTGRVLDIGAGVCALPLWLAQQGSTVVTIDSSPHQRNSDDSDKTHWNEWGYLDYSRLDARITSHHLDAQLYQIEEPFDTIYSVSVIEHMPANVRRNILNKLPSWLAPGGRVLFSLDLTPGTDDLWPLSEGQVVDLKQPHGTLDDIKAEMEQAGLRIVEVTVRRGIAGSRTDIAFIEAALVKTSTTAVPRPSMLSKQKQRSFLNAFAYKAWSFACAKWAAYKKNR